MALLGGTLTCTLIQAADKTSPFYVAATDLPRGHILAEGDLTTAQVKPRPAPGVGAAGELPVRTGGVAAERAAMLVGHGRTVIT